MENRLIATAERIDAGRISGISSESRDLLERFYQLFLLGNAEQNLSRLTGAEDFWNLHIVDCLELVSTGWVPKGAQFFDLGTGGGVPGIPFAILNQSKGELIDSERRKIEFVSGAVSELNIEGLVGRWGRFEDVLAGRDADFIISRAVGKLSRLLPWISKCSTWNKLILFKGPNWQSEWDEYLSDRKLSRKHPVSIKDTHSYTVGGKQRLLVLIQNVPRGTT